MAIHFIGQSTFGWIQCMNRYKQFINTLNGSGAYWIVFLHSKYTVHSSEELIVLNGCLRLLEMYAEDGDRSNRPNRGQSNHADVQFCVVDRWEMIIYLWPIRIFFWLIAVFHWFILYYSSHLSEEWKGREKELSSHIAESEE